MGYEIEKIDEERTGVASEVFDGSPGSIEKHETPSLLDLEMESEEAENIAVMPSAPAKPEEMIFSFRIPGDLKKFSRIHFFQWS